MTPPRVAPGEPGDPLRLVFGIHLHQPEGNFHEVFEEHARTVYHPLVRQLVGRRLGPVLLHLSGPLLEWLEAHDTPLLDHLGRLASDGAVEFLLGGMYEPILAAIPRADRMEQIGWLRDALRARFGVAGDGLWLTERVWEPDLAADLASAGVRYVLVDDRHFLVSGFRREDLHVPYRTEYEGRTIALLAIDERLRYLIPFRPPATIAAYLRELHAAGRPLAVFADDGEKFGAWPGTREWVYERGWFDAFCDMLDALRDEGVLRLARGHEAIDAVPSGGLAYLPTASYREMEAWALPSDAAHRLGALENDLGPIRLGTADGAFIRGSHWRHFLVKYSEANLLHKKAVALSAVCRARGNPAEARRAIGRAQCNDALWHGVFGGLYLPWLRAALWRQLAIAERCLRRGERIAAEVLDLDADGHDEIAVHSAAFSALVAPARGGALRELVLFDSEINYAGALTRRLEAYHGASLDQGDSGVGAGHAGGTAPHEGALSIHELPVVTPLNVLPPLDLDERAIGVARILGGDVTERAYADAQYVPLRSWARTRCTAAVEIASDEAICRCVCGAYEVEWRFSSDGRVQGHWRWDASSLPVGARFAPELSLAAPLRIHAPDALAVWRYDISTVVRSERGAKWVRQGEAITPLFDARAGSSRISLREP